MDVCESKLSEVEQKELQVESLKRLIVENDEKHRAAIIAAESFLNYLRHLYGYDF